MLQVVTYVVTRPGRELLFVVVSEDEKYKAKVWSSFSFILFPSYSRLDITTYNFHFRTNQWLHCYNIADTDILILKFYIFLLFPGKYIKWTYMLMQICIDVLVQRLGDAAAAGMYKMLFGTLNGNPSTASLYGLPVRVNLSFCPSSSPIVVLVNKHKKKKNKQ